MNTTETDTDLIIKIPCCGKTKLNWRSLFVYTNRIVMKDDDKEEIIFEEKYTDMLSLNHKHNSNLLKAAMVLEMKNGQKYDITLDVNHTLEGKRVTYFNPEISQISKTLPNFINKLIEKSI